MDATVEIYWAQLNDFEPLDEILRACHIVADTNYALAEILGDVEGFDCTGSRQTLCANDCLSGALVDCSSFASCSLSPSCEGGSK
jgi:hypothetical protein